VGGREWRAVAVIGAFMAAITGSEGGGNYDRLKRGGGEILGGDRWGLHGVGEGGGGIHGTVVREEEAALGRRGVGGRNAGWAPWAKQASGWLGRLGQNLKEISFQNKKWFFEYIKTLEICTKRFRRNFDMVIFPKFF
jgi:hypothetical protein